MTPAWLLDIFAAFMLVVAAVSAARLVAARSWVRGAAVAGSAGPDVDVAHLLMGIAMAGMFTASLTTLSNTAWEVIFGLMTAWFAWRVWCDARANGTRALAGGHCAPHLVHSAAMLYMFLALASSAGGGSGMGGMGGSAGMQTLKYPTLAFVFALILVGYSVWDLDQLSGARRALAAAGTPLAPAGVPAMAAAESAGAAASGPAAMGDAATIGTRAADEALSGEPPGSGPSIRALLLAPGTATGCRIVMGISMALILVIMI
ncbi:MAG TPA: DUF5134 domain-containing protein [Streptosporangiaceae bacterium]|nr:DUF5134 domain-containing protein [Streptosporangiaceae bacterium]